MRIIGGTHAGRRLNPPATLPVRPTTDLAKESLFNVLRHRMDFDGLRALDLFAGTGNIAFELASRGASEVVAVDIHGKCLQYIRATADALGLPAIRTLKADVLKYLRTGPGEFDFVFADPPYDLPQLPQLPALALEAGLLRTGGLLLLEHSANRRIALHPYLVDQRTYGKSAFSIFQP